MTPPNEAGLQELKRIDLSSFIKIATMNSAGLNIKENKPRILSISPREKKRKKEEGGEKKKENKCILIGKSLDYLKTQQNIAISTAEFRIWLTKFCQINLT